MNASQHIAALNLNGSTASLASGGSIVLVTGTLTASGSGTLDLADDSLIVSTMPPNNLRLLLQSGYAGGAWTGWGVRSSVAAAHPGTGIAFGTAASLFPHASRQLFRPNHQQRQRHPGSIYPVERCQSGQRGQSSRPQRIGHGFRHERWNHGHGDFDYSGVVEIGDFNILAMEFNTSSASPQSACLWRLSRSTCSATRKLQLTIRIFNPSSVDLRLQIDHPNTDAEPSFESIDELENRLPSGMAESAVRRNHSCAAGGIQTALGDFHAVGNRRR